MSIEQGLLPSHPVVRLEVERTLQQFAALVDSRKIWLTTKEYAELHGVSTRTVARWEEGGAIPLLATNQQQGKAKRIWKFFDAVSGTYILGLRAEHAFAGKPRATTTAKRAAHQ